MKAVAIDVGGTFTDCLVMEESGVIREFKAPSTPPEFVGGVADSLEKAARYYAVPLAEFLGQVRTIIHGTTVATNALLTRTGARVGMITTKGFRDIYQMRRGIKLSSIYDLFVPPYEPLVPRYLRVGVEERTLHNGDVLAPVSTEDVQAALEHFAKYGVNSIAICYLHSYANPKNEQETVALCKAQRPDMYVTSSHEILPVWREYERFSTTVAAAYVGAAVDRYLSALDAWLRSARFGGQLLIIANSGLVEKVERCRKSAVHLIGSGPAAGAAAGVYWGKAAGQTNVISLDIGGTSSDITLIHDGEIPTTTESWVGDERIAVKKVAVHSFAGGGGSIASVNALGILTVGPRSAGARPGPACYDRSGVEATVTDACVLMGYLDPGYFLGGEMKLCPDLAEAAVGKVGQQLGLGVSEAATAIFTVTNSLIAGRVASICTKRGHDPRDYVLVAGGGGGGMHGAWVARTLEIPLVIVPRFAGLYSAFGMFAIDLGWEYARSYPITRHQIQLDVINGLYAEMEAEAREAMQGLGVTESEVVLTRTADMRYVGQYHEVTTDIPNKRLAADDLDVIAANFHARHEKLYAFAMPGRNLEFLTFRLRVAAKQPLPNLRTSEPATGERSPTLKGSRLCLWNGQELETPIFDERKLRPGNVVDGPAVIEGPTSTVVVPRGDRCQVSEYGHHILYIERSERS